MTTPPPPLPPTPREYPSTRWFKRNWPWAVPVCAVVLAGCLLFVVSVVIGVMKKSDAYLIPFGRARAAPAVVAELGEPIRDGWLMEGNIQLTNNDGTANLAFPLKGPKGQATVYVVGTKTAGRWHFRQVMVAFDSGHPQVDLSDP